MTSAPSHMNNQNFVFLQEQGTELKLSILGEFSYFLPLDKLHNGAVASQAIMICGTLVACLMLCQCIVARFDVLSAVYLNVQVFWNLTVLLDEGQFSVFHLLPERTYMCQNSGS